MLSLNYLAKIIIWINCFIIAALLMAWLTPFSFRVGPRFFPLLALFCLAFCIILALVALLVRRLGNRSSWSSGEFCKGACLSGLVFAYSLIVVYILIPPINDGLLSIFRITKIYQPSSDFYYEKAIISPSRENNIRLICFAPIWGTYWDDKNSSFAFLTVERMFIFRQRIETFEMNTCSSWEVEKAFSWSNDERYLRWDNSVGGTGIVAPKKGEIRAF